MADEGFLRTSDLAKLFGIREETVRHWARDGRLPPAVQAGRARLWSKADIAAWIERMKSASCETSR